MSALRTISTNICAVVISDDHYNSLGVIRSLGENGIKIILILLSEGKTFVDKSKYICKTIRTNHDEKNIIDIILDVTSENVEYYLFPLSDFAANTLDKNAQAISKSNIICPNALGQLEKLQNKEESKHLALKCGLLVPDGRVVTIIEGVHNWECYPSIIKPLISSEGKKSDIKIVRNKHELDEAIKLYQMLGYKRALIEEYIHGEDEYMFEIMGYCDKDYKPHFAGVIKKYREFPVKNGSTSYANIGEIVNIELKKNLKDMLGQSCFFGLFDIEFKHANGKDYYIECNYRNGAPGYAFSRFGRNIPCAWIYDYRDKALGKGWTPVKSVDIMFEQTDIINMLKGDVDRGKWIIQFMFAKKIFWSFRDFIPNLVYYWNFVMGRLKNGSTR